MAYRDLRTALEGRRDALAERRAELDQQVAKLDGARGERTNVEGQLREVEAHLDEVRKHRLPLLSRIQVASPCNARWEDMRGNDRVRFCGKCEKNVYNLSELGEDEAEALVYEQEGTLCVRFFRRKDGSVLTSDCHVGKRKRRRIALAAVGMAASAALGGYVTFGGTRGATMGAISVVPHTPAVIGSAPAPAPRR